METSLMETDEIVFGNPVAEHAETNEVVPVEVSETRAKPPEIEKSPVQQVNILDLSKLSPEVQQGYRVYMEMSADSYKNVTWPFLEPVDAEKLGLWDYHERIKEPMSFHQIGYKFNNYQYNSITEVVGDIRLILENCYRYNGSNHWVSKLGHKMEKILEQKLALLNRSLRDKVSLEATMALKSEFTPAESTGTDGTSRRRTAARVSYVNMINGEGSSSLLTRLKIQEDIEERERRRIREKEKKEANLVLLQDLAEWEEKELGPDLVKQLHSMWEIPSLAGLLFLLKDFLYIQDLNITELELSFIYANKSSLLARIFTALLVTPHQRKSLFKKPPMKFKVWESKLCDRLNSWYKAIEKDGQMFTCHNLGLDMATFEMLGEENPLLEKSYMDLTLHQRVWILKCLCDNSLVRDYDFREHLSTIAPTEQRDMVLGNDANSWSYLYFPIFSASDLRIYKQCPLDVPTLSKRKKKVAPPPPPPAPTKVKGTSTRPATPTQPKRDSRLRKLRKGTPSPEPEAPNPPSPPPAVEEQEQEPKKTIAEGFELAAFDVESLKKLCEKFAEPPPPPKKRGRKPKPPPPRKRCEIDLHTSLLALVEELEKYEVSFSKLMSKAKIKIMKESQEPEPVDEPEEVVPAAEEEEWGSEESVEDEIEDAGARNMSSDEDFILENEESGNNKSPTSEQVNEDGEEGENKGNAATQISLPQKRKAEEAASIVEESKQSVVSPGIYDEDDSCTIAIQTTPPRLKKKRKKHSPGTEVKPEAVPQTAAATVLQGETAVMPSTSLPKIPQGIRQNILHIPAALHSVTGKRTVDVTGRTSATVNTNNTVSVSGLSTKSVLPSTRVTQPERKASSVRILSRTPATLNASASSTVAAQPSSSVVVSSTTLCGTASNQAVTVSKSVTTASVSVAAQHLQSQLSAAVSAGLGKVMLVSSSGAPLQVLKTVSVSQPLIQGNTSNPAVLTTQESTGKCVVPSSSSLLNHVGVATLTSSSLIAKSTTSQLPSSAAPKVAISVTPSKLSSVLSASPVFLVQRPGSGGVVPLAVKGGAIVMPPSSAPQQVVVIRPSSSLTSSTTSTTTQLSGTGIAVLGNTQIAQTALGHKVLLSTTLPPKTKIVNKPVDQVAKTPLQVKPSEIKNSSLALGNKPITVKTTASSTSSVTTASNSTISVTRVPDPKPNCATLPVGNEQAGLETVASSEITIANKQSVNVGSNRVCDTERSGIAIATLASNLEPVKETESHEMTTVSPERDLAQTKVICEDESLPLKTINTSKSSRPEITADGIVEEKARIELHDTDKDAENGSDPLVDLTCYETSVSDSTCGESDDSTAPNGLHPDLKTSVPCKRVEIDVKLCNGVGRSVTPDTNSVEQELDSGERSHAVTDQATNGVLMTET